MKTNPIILVCLFMLQLNLFSQHETRYWYFGINAGLDFATSPPTILSNGMVSTNEGCAAVSDTSGNLLFYTSGVDVYDKNHVLMANGSGLYGNTSTSQSAIIVKQPGSSSQYYVFTLSVGPVGSLYYSIVDMTQGSGLGAVTSKNIFLADTLTEKLVSVMHCNGKDFWILAHDSYSDKFRCFLLTSSGVSPTAVITSIGSTHGPSTSWIGNMKVSPNGRKLGVATSGTPGMMELFDFDNATGVVSNLIQLGNFQNIYGCEFSPNGSKFYGAGGDNIQNILIPIKLHQWDVCAGSPSAIIASHYTVSVPSIIMGMQRASDGKIYIARVNSHSLAVISNPDASGALCNYSHSGQSLGSKTSYVNLPNFNTTFSKPAPLPFTYSLNCNSTTFYAPNVTNTVSAGCGAAAAVAPTNVLWNFGDPGSGAANSSTLSIASHNYPSPGTYTAQMIAYSACSVDSLSLPITIMQIAPSLSVAGTFTVCKGEKRIYTVSGANSYTWQTGAHTSTIAITAPSVSTTYSLSGSSSEINSCTASTQFTVVVEKCTGVESESEKGKAVSIYPNPASDKLFIESNSSVRIRIMDKTGQILLEKSFEQGKNGLDVSTFRSGIYFIQAVAEKAVTNMRLIKLE